MSASNFWAEGFWQTDFWQTDFWADSSELETPSIQRAKLNRADFALWDGGVKTTTRMDITGGYVAELTVGEEVDVLQVYGSGTKRTYTTLSNAIDRVGSNRACFLIGSGIWAINDDITIPENISCRITAGCSFTVTSGKTLTFNGPVYVENPSWWTGDDGAVLTNLGARGFPNY